MYTQKITGCCYEWEWGKWLLSVCKIQSRVMKLQRSELDKMDGLFSLTLSPSNCDLQYMASNKLCNVFFPLKETNLSLSNIRQELVRLQPLVCRIPEVSSQWSSNCIEFTLHFAQLFSNTNHNTSQRASIFFWDLQKTIKIWIHMDSMVLTQSYVD